MHDRNANGETLIPTLIAAVILAGVLASITAQWPVPQAVLGTPTPTPTATFTATATPTPTATATPTPTATVTPTPSPTSTATPLPSQSPAIIDGHFWFQRPISPEVTDWVAHFYPYGSTANGQHPIHHGVEFVNEIGTPILAAGSGRVVAAGPDDTRVFGPKTDFYGLLVVIEMDLRYHGQPLYTLYGHMSKVLVEEGDRVEPGQPIGRVGMSGVALGPHLHFEVRIGQDTYAHTGNPELWLQPRPGNGTLAARVLDRSGRPVYEAKATIQRADEQKIFREATTYPRTEVNPDDEWQENLVLGDLPAGEWRLAVRVGDRTLGKDLTIEAAKLTFVVLHP